MGCGGGVIVPPPRLGRCACASDVTTTRSKMQTREMEMGELVFMDALCLQDTTVGSETKSRDLGDFF